MVWYHWECVQVIEEPAGQWLCPACSVSAVDYVKQLVKKRAASPLVPKFQESSDVAASKAKEHKPESKKQGVAKKGVATKKPAAQKPKPRWLGWVELSSDGEEEFKRKVDAEWTVEEGITRKRRRTSKAMADGTESGSGRLRPSSRAQGKKRAVLTDSDEEKATDGETSIYQKEEEEGKEDQDQDPEDPEDSMDMESQDEKIEANVSNHSDGSEYDEFHSALSRISATTSNGGEVAESQSPPLGSEPARWREDAMDVDADSDSHEDQDSGTSFPATESNDFATLYRRQGNCWGEFPESAIRSTLPRLG